MDTRQTSFIGSLSEFIAGYIYAVSKSTSSGTPYYSFQLSPPPSPDPGEDLTGAVSITVEEVDQEGTVVVTASVELDQPIDIVWDVARHSMTRFWNPIDRAAMLREVSGVSLPPRGSPIKLLKFLGEETEPIDLFETADESCKDNPSAPRQTTIRYGIIKDGEDIPGDDFAVKTTQTVVTVKKGLTKYEIEDVYSGDKLHDMMQTLYPETDGDQWDALQGCLTQSAGDMLISIRTRVKRNLERSANLIAYGRSPEA